MAAFYQSQMDKLALVSALVARGLLRSVWQKRTLWVRPRSHLFPEVTMARWDDDYWKQNFRIGRPTFRFLCSQPPSSTLWRLGFAVHDLYTATVDKLLEQYIRIATGSNAQPVVDSFLCTWCFPQCFGAIDGSHIPIVAPRDNPLDYYNRKGTHSIVLGIQFVLQIHNVCT